MGEGLALERRRVEDDECTICGTRNNWAEHREDLFALAQRIQLDV